MITGDYDRLQEIARNNVCAKCKGPLEVAWLGEKKTWVLKCACPEYPDAVIRQLSLTEEHKAGTELPPGIKENVEKGMRRRAMTQGKTKEAGKFGLVPSKDLGSDKLLLPEEVEALIVYAEKYHLDPYRSHVVAMYGKPYITIDGYLYHANARCIPYSLTGRPVNDEERKGLGLVKGDIGWRSEVILLDKNQSFVGIGLVTKKEQDEEAKGQPGVKRYPVVASKPQLMAQKRGDWQALRRAFPIGGE